MKCPLCLNTLSSSSKLLRFCPHHPESIGEVMVTDQNYASVFCHGGAGGLCNFGAVDEAPILIHIGCPMENPFRTGKGFQIPSNVYYVTDTGQKKITSWQLDSPRLLARTNSSRHEMWFPLQLFLAVNRVQGHRGSSVLLLGEQEAGKSVLATMAVRDDTWRLDSSVLTAAYVYIAPSMGIIHSNGDQYDEVRAEEYIHNLAATVRADGKLMGPTPTRERNIRALFLSESGTVEPNVREAADTGAEKVSLSSFFSRLVIESEEVKPSQPGKSMPRPPNRNESTVVFYDVAGEQARTALDGQIVQLSAHFDQCAVVLDIRQLACFGPAGTSAEVNGLETALQNVRRRSRDVSTPHCLVVTKLDLLREDDPMTPDRAVAVQAIRKMLSVGNNPKFAAFLRSLQSPETYEALSQTSEKEVLLELLRRSDDPIERVLQDHVKEDSWPVFFVWTEGLGRGKPYSVGVRRFIRDWCMARKELGTARKGL